MLTRARGRISLIAVLISFPMGCYSVGCGMANRTRLAMQSGTRCTAAVHMMLWFGFTMTLATSLRRTSTRATG